MINYKFLSKEESSVLLSKDDDYTLNLNQKNLDLLMKPKKNVSFLDYKKMLSNSSINFNPRLIGDIKKIMTSINKFWVKFDLPDLDISFIHTNGKDAFNLPYTRGSSIILPERFAYIPYSHLEGLVVHEMFHVLSRKYPKLRDPLYSYFGFYKISKFNYENILLNPDAPIVEWAISLEDKKDKRKFEAIPAIYLEGFSDSRSYVFDNNSKKLILINETNYLDLIKNTEYLVHPEEICADHFAFMYFHNKKVPRSIKNKILDDDDDGNYFNWMADDDKYSDKVADLSILMGFQKLVDDFKF